MKFSSKTAHHLGRIITQRPEWAGGHPTRRQPAGAHRWQMGGVRAALVRLGAGPYTTCFTSQLTFIEPQGAHVVSIYNHPRPALQADRPGADMGVVFA
jgi:hypothetical protein